MLTDNWWGATPEIQGCPPPVHLPPNGLIESTIVVRVPLQLIPGCPDRGGRENAVGGGGGEDAREQSKIHLSTDRRRAREYIS